MIPQLAITTHSSHILEEADFSKVRYFKRCHVDGESDEKKTLSSTTVKSLRSFSPKSKSEDGKVEDDPETLNFLRRYLKLTHCDLFFADAAILVEGGVEKLLLPEMIKKSAPKLSRLFLTTLEVGGAFAHRFASLLEFLGIPYLIITDLDSVDPDDGHKVCIASRPNAVTSNASIKFFLEKVDISELNQTEEFGVGKNGFVCFQKPFEIGDPSAGEKMHSRTFEESFIYENLGHFQNGPMSMGLDTNGSFSDLNNEVFERVKSPGFKKMEFALKITANTFDWKCPSYINNGLKWLEETVNNSDRVSANIE